jgi:N-acetyl-anhydromuramyl-L-alanine amidase AmpD
VIQHHWAGIGGGIERMSSPTEAASCTYIIKSDGTILGHVPEEFRPWTSGSYEADVNSITYEVQNTGGQVNGNDSDPRSWPVSDAAYDAIIRLTADIARRYGWPAINEATYQGHRQHYSTACPGGFLWSRMAQTRELAQQALTGGLSLQSAEPVYTADEQFFIDLSIPLP